MKKAQTSVSYLINLAELWRRDSAKGCLIKKKQLIQNNHKLRNKRVRRGYLEKVKTGESWHRRGLKRERCSGLENKGERHPIKVETFGKRKFSGKESLIEWRKPFQRGALTTCWRVAWKKLINLSTKASWPAARKGKKKTRIWEIYHRKIRRNWGRNQGLYDWQGNLWKCS